MTVLPEIANRMMIKGSVLSRVLFYLFINLLSNPFKFLTEKANLLEKE